MVLLILLLLVFILFSVAMIACGILWAPRTSRTKTELVNRIAPRMKDLTDETSCILVSTQGIAKSCQVHPKDMNNKTKFDHSDYKHIQNKDKVYVIACVLHKFTESILPTLEKNEIKITLVVGSDVSGFPIELSSKHAIPYVERVCNSPSILHLYCQNYDLPYQHQRITPIPLGLDYHTLAARATEWGPKASPADQERELRSISATSPVFEKRLNKTFSFFQFRLFKNRHDGDRLRALQALKDKEFNIFLPKKLPRKKTWKELAKHKFCISPHGNGLDCHRTYEAMCLGSIPIVQSSSLDILFRGMPVIIVKKWGDLNIDVLLHEASAVRKRANQETLKLQYWIDRINSNVKSSSQTLTVGPRAPPYPSLSRHPLHVACGLCVRNCAPHLPKIFRNIDLLRDLFETVTVVFVHDNCRDDSVSYLKRYQQERDKVVIIDNNSSQESKSSVRTVRIACARNAFLNHLDGLSDVAFHFVVDADNVNASVWNLETIHACLVRADQWDSVSFTRNTIPLYYDIWALMREPYLHDCWGFGADSKKVTDFMRKDIRELLRRTKTFLPVLSAFNGVALYKTALHRGLRYDGTPHTIRRLITDEERRRTVDLLRKDTRLPRLKIVPRPNMCEHLSYHLRAIRERGLRVCIWPYAIDRDNGIHST